ncbi:feruloyl-CoA synthetase [Sulfitobacter sp. SK012]|uniref:feruloyl-CoA synthase n=1 Tax=Sulfitobacter sp. SK012 TaxID=1389005 RepID=UPI000E0C1631|nr:feruloyl-CoA synthase [Sulfitobacter sp. SK012]AXI48072.1 feruloyl-CoA synthetase [Sulfitobacter sp. SK012]
MRRTSQFLPHSVTRHDRPDGTILLRSNYEMGPVVEKTGDWLHHWAQATPDAVFIAERSGAGWRTESYGATLQKVRAIGQALLARGMGQDTPILIMSGNGVDHALLSLAAQYIGVPTVPVAEQYSLVSAAHGRLLQAVELTRPAMAYVVDAGRYAEALSLDALAKVEIIASQPGMSSATPFDALIKGDAGVDVDAAHASVTPQTVAKILMTSGSTSVPKGVLTTHRMMCANQTQLADALPFLRERPPRVMDWLPWNHVFGGSHNFNMMLANGGALYIDDGKPVEGLFDRTIQNLGMVAGTLCFNVPLGFQMLLNALQKDTGLRHRFFENLDLIFYAGASLPQDVWEGFENMAMEVKGEVPLMTSSWGLTETAPALMIQQEPTDRSGVVGVPATGVVVKLVPDDEMRCEVRVKGPNVMEGYLNAPEKTAEAFDAEGFFITGDAMRFVDPENPNKGLKFDGRMSEDFKLLTGTWVRAGQLRLDMLARLAPLAADLVITGADKDQIGLMIFPNIAEVKRAGFSAVQTNGVLCDPNLRKEIGDRLVGNATGSSSSTYVSRAIVLSDPASMALGEMTAKGNLNFRTILTRRADLLTRLYDNNDPAVAKI